MPRSVLFLAIVCVAACGSVPGHAQVPTCRQGTLAGVLGTSCSVGKLILNFQNDYQGLLILDDGAVIIPINPGDIGFVPVVNGDQAGFRLVLNFSDGPGPDHTVDSAHFVAFSCLPQSAPGFDIRAQSLDAAIGTQAPADAAEVDVVESQFYDNLFTELIGVGRSVFQGNVLFNQASNAALLNFPALLSTGVGSEFTVGFNTPPSPATIQMVSFASGSGIATLPSASFLYTTGERLPPPPLAHLTYTNIDIPGVITSVSGINNAGVMVGSFEGTDPNSTTLFDTHGFIRDANGGITIIDMPGALLTVPAGMNERGTVAGVVFNPDFSLSGFLWRDGNFTLVNFPGARSTNLTGINNREELVGQFEENDLNVRGFLLAGGKFTVIDHNPPIFSFPTNPTDISDNGTIVGGFSIPDAFRGFIQRNDTFQIADVPDQGFTQVMGINDKGDLVGFYSDRAGISHGYLRSNGKFFTVDFPQAVDTVPVDTVPFHINAQGTIVGSYRDATGAHSFRADPRADDGTVTLPQTSAVLLPYKKPACPEPHLRRLAELLHNENICRALAGPVHP